MILRRIPRRVVVAMLALAACAAMVIALRTSDRVAPGGSFPDPCALLTADEVTDGLVDQLPRIALAGDDQARPRRVHCTYETGDFVRIDGAVDPRLELAATGSGGCRPDGAVGPREVDVSGVVGRLDRDTDGASLLVFCRDGLRITLSTGTAPYGFGTGDQERAIVEWSRLVMSRWDEAPRVDGAPAPLPEPLASPPPPCDVVTPDLAAELTGTGEGTPVGTTSCRWLGARGDVTITVGRPPDRRERGVSMRDSASFELRAVDVFGSTEVDVPGAVASAGVLVGIGDVVSPTSTGEGELSLAADGFLVRVSVRPSSVDPETDAAAAARAVAIDVVEGLRR